MTAEETLDKREQEIREKLDETQEGSGHEIALMYEGALEKEWLFPETDDSLSNSEIADLAQRLATEVADETSPRTETLVIVTHVALGDHHTEATGYHFFPCGKYTPEEKAHNPEPVRDYRRW